MGAVNVATAGRRLRIGVYDLYWHTLGGGEQVDGSIAELLSVDHDVTLLGPQEPDLDRTLERLGVDLSRCGFSRVFDDPGASAASAEFDVFINGTYLSTAINQAPVGYYYVHFPGEVPSRRDRVRHRLGRLGTKALSLPPRLPHRLREVRAGFDRRVIRTEFVGSYQRYLANSTFTAEWVERLWGTPADVLYPPVRPSVQPGNKRPLILVLGRFFDPRRGHSKKQLELLEAFIEATDAGGLPDWELALVGGADADDREYALAVKRLAQHRPVTVHFNAPGEVVRTLLAEATLFWHGAGLGERADQHPQRFEHFGIAVIEAMAAGAVPLVFGAAGPAEIVRDGVDGYHWQTLEELIEHTTALAANPSETATLSAHARERAQDFSADRFASELRRFIAVDIGS
jgi:glycosyltransferase involved in cell wall biosynthesis